MMLILFTFSVPAWSEKITVRHTKENPREAVLVGTDTGVERLVREGDRVDGSIVREIHRSHVTLVTPLNARRAVAAKIPVMDEVFFAPPF